jgi:hypothetical protein
LADGDRGALGGFRGNGAGGTGGQCQVFDSDLIGVAVPRAALRHGAHAGPLRNALRGFFHDPIFEANRLTDEIFKIDIPIVRGFSQHAAEDTPQALFGDAELFSEKPLRGQTGVCHYQYPLEGSNLRLPCTAGQCRRHLLSNQSYNAFVNHL